MNRASKIFLLTYFFISIGIPAQYLFGIKKADAVTATIMVSFYFITSAIFGIIFSRLSDKLMKRRIFVLGGLLLIAIAFTGYFFASASSPLQLIVCSSFIGISVGAYSPNSIALFTEMEPTISKGKLMGYFHVVNSAGWAVGALVGGVVDQYFGDLVFLFAAVSIIIGLSIYFFKIHDIPP
ncbi:MAG: MFS transporter [Candidatus Helarchaeota archaeon]|nr:MFS transporter [Candidatus Helarchaeota archaeon]